MISLGEQDLQGNPHSICDPNGRVFSWNGRLLRGVREVWLPIWERLNSTGLYRRLAEDRILIETEIADIAADGYAMVLEHRRIPFVSYPHEWPASGFADAAALVVELLRVLAEHDLTLQDGHFGNVMMDGVSPVYVDITSIVDTGCHAVWPSYGEFCIAVAYPLILYAHGHERIARMLSWEEDGVSADEVAALVGKRHVESFEKLVRGGRLMRTVRKVTRWQTLMGGVKAVKTNRKERSKRFLKQLRKEVFDARDRLHNDACEIECGRIQEAECPVLDERTLDGLLDELQPDDVFWAGSQLSRYAVMAAERGINGVIADSDPGKIDLLYLAGRREGWRRLFPVVLDVVRPTPELGTLGYSSISAAERFACDLFIGIGLSELVLRERRLTNRHLVACLRMFSKKAVLLDVPADGCGKDWTWFDAEGFMELFRQEFAVVRELSIPGNDRKIIVGVRP